VVGALPPQAMPREAAQLAVNDGDQFIARLRVASSPSGKQRVDAHRTCGRAP